MELKDFVQRVLLDLVEAVEGASTTAVRKMKLTDNEQHRTVEFDIAVTVEQETNVTGKGGIRVLHFVEAGGDVGEQTRNATVSRVQFGVKIDPWTKEEEKRQREEHSRPAHVDSYR
ncbi:MAG: hypothetical protein Q7S96_04245 [bacterium]|nr:hypothetical protein [bacterium]